MPRVLRDIRITEVSSVNRGAGRGVKIMLMKRDLDEPVIEHRAATWTDVEIKLEERAREQAEIDARISILEGKEGHTMTDTILRKALAADEYELTRIVLTAIDDGQLTKGEVQEILDRRVMKNLRQGETYQQGFARLLADGADHVGAQIFRKFMGMRGEDAHVTALRKQEAERRLAKAKSDDNRRNPLNELTEMAEAFRKVHPNLSAAQAFTRIAETPEGQRLYREEKAARLAAAAQV